VPLSDVTIRFLELTPASFRPKRSTRPGVTFAKVDPAVPELSRFFYAAVGGRWFWLDRRPWTPAEWKAHLHRPDEVETWVLAVEGVPAGFVELERRDAGVFEINYLGLLDAFLGQGLGAHLLTCGVERALALGAEKVILNTCNLDHPKALANYAARGFATVRTEVRRKEVPVSAPGPW
jgi:GNAT superfamily N-acetyltransferase